MSAGTQRVTIDLSQKTLTYDPSGDVELIIVNWDIANGLRDALRNTGFDARPVRNPDRDARPGPSGYPGWQESAVYFIKALGAPSAVWDIGINDYARDINRLRRREPASRSTAGHHRGSRLHGHEASRQRGALHDDRFKQIVAYAIRDGLHEWAGLPPPEDEIE